ncbi:hypothetical protein K227x_51860 [Rubripirellula lacrimiformis]|uniref:Uncharacterized protein n=1 Tax=Rubripirellula lacrimiformis TaxID=1930273 RepID=A0A517NI05_9BACT|nr:hypothetical protein K227x_51860 [Rubripirellula lacrimiformis]
MAEGLGDIRYGASQLIVGFFSFSAPARHRQMVFANVQTTAVSGARIPLVFNELSALCESFVKPFCDCVNRR